MKPNEPSRTALMIARQRAAHMSPFKINAARIQAFKNQKSLEAWYRPSDIARDELIARAASSRSFPGSILIAGTTTGSLASSRQRAWRSSPSIFAVAESPMANDSTSRNS
jgi:hypothetical protein